MLATIRFRAFCLLVCCQKNLKIRIFKTIILPVVLYGCETWLLTLIQRPVQCSLFDFASREAVNYLLKLKSGRSQSFVYQRRVTKYSLLSGGETLLCEQNRYSRI
jgi:hypothetical protein